MDVHSMGTVIRHPETITADLSGSTSILIDGRLAAQAERTLMMMG
jgi:hypothetical protein